MKVLSYVHAYPPDHNAGAEWMLHAVNKFLQFQGHDVRVIIRGGDIVTVKNGRKIYRKPSKDEAFDGVEIYRHGEVKISEQMKWCDLVITHLDLSGKAINLGRVYEKPVVHLIHNTHHNDVLVHINPKNNHVVYNCETTKKALNYALNGCVLFPPVDYKDYEVKTNKENITLINCWPDKGGKVLVDLAKSLPDRKFLGVMGGYGDQVIGNLKNLKYEENTPDIKKVYKKTGILIMPSVYESWGRVAIEAMSSGIPVIAHPTPGLKESLDYAGLFAHRDQLGEWVKIIEDLDDKEYYEKVSSLCKKRAMELTAKTDKQLEGLEKFMENILKKGYEL